MKVERKEKAFEPVVITLESAQELSTMITLLRVAKEECSSSPNIFFARNILVELEEHL